MAAGTHTKFLVGLMLLVNALVLVNIRRYSPELPRGVCIRCDRCCMSSWYFCKLVAACADSCSRFLLSGL